MSELEDEKTSLEVSVQQLRAKNAPVQVTEDSLRKMFSVFRTFVAERNIPECKKFIDSYVEKVLVFKGHLEVTFKVAFSVEQKDDAYLFKTSVKITNLFKRYSKAIAI